MTKADFWRLHDRLIGAQGTLRSAINRADTRALPLDTAEVVADHLRRAESLVLTAATTLNHYPKGD